jgi:hypothetical protein
MSAQLLSSALVKQSWGGNVPGIFANNTEVDMSFASAASVPLAQITAARSAAGLGPLTGPTSQGPGPAVLQITHTSAGVTTKTTA